MSVTESYLLVLVVLECAAIVTLGIVAFSDWLDWRTQ